MTEEPISVEQAKQIVIRRLLDRLSVHQVDPSKAGPLHGVSASPDDYYGFSYFPGGPPMIGGGHYFAVSKRDGRVTEHEAGE